MHRVMERGDSDEVNDNIKTGSVKWQQPHNCMKVVEFKEFKRALPFPACLQNRFFIKCMVRVSLMDCLSCDSLPPLGLLPCLEELRVESMNNIKKAGPEFYGQTLNPFPALKILDFSHMSSWNKWSHSTSADSNTTMAFPLLEQLSISHCESLQGCLPLYLLSVKKISVSYCPRLSITFTSLGLPLLEYLSIIKCESLMSTAPVTLNQLHIYNCDNIQSVELNKSSSATSSDVQEIYIADCKSLITVEIPEKISWLKIRNCESLKFLIFDRSLKNPLKFIHLVVLRIAKCPQLLSFPDNLYLPTIKELMIEDNATLNGLPNQIHNFTSLEYLSIVKCPNILSFPRGGFPRNLKTLHIEYMSIRQPLEEWGLGLLDSLQELRLCDTGCSSASVECIPSSELQLPSTSLSKLEISHFQSLKSISWDLPNLTDFHVNHCPRLESLGDESCLPPKFKSVLILNCQKHVCDIGNKLLRKLNPYDGTSFDSWAYMPF